MTFDAEAPSTLPPMKPAGLLVDLKVDMADGNSSPELEMFLRNRDTVGHFHTQRFTR